MIKNYLKLALRTFKKHRSFTLLNTLGLSLGLAASILILQYVKYESSFDQFHNKAEDIYRIQYNVIQNGITTVECAAAVPAVGPEMKNNFPEVLNFTRLFPLGGVVSHESTDRGFISFREEKMQFADPRVFEIFDFQLIKGNPETALEEPNKAVISQRAAKKYFGDQDPIGKIIKWGWSVQQDFEITALMEDVPANSHIKFDILLSFETLNNLTGNNSETNWGWYDFNTYVLLKSGIDVEMLQSKWNEHLQEVRGEQWARNNSREEFLFQPLTDIHLYSNLLQESQPEEQGDGESVYFLTIIAFFILIIAWVNYMNLSTAKSFERANEVGIRKVMGAEKRQLFSQFMSESLIINFAATLLAILIVWLAWPSFAAISGRDIPLEYILDVKFWLLVGGLFAGGTLLAGFYPAIVLSSFRPIAVLKGKLIKSPSGNAMRKGLVVFQFVASVFLISGTAIVYQQLDFMRNRDLGVDINQTLVVKGPGITDSLYQQKLNTFKTEALRVPGVRKLTVGSNIPGNEIFWTRGIRRLQGGPESGITIYVVGVDHDYIDAYNLSLAAGRNFSRDYPNDHERALLNIELLKALEFESPEEAIGQKVNVGGDTLEIVGILNNYHQMSLKNKVAPIVFKLDMENAFFSFKIESQNYREILSAVKEHWDVQFAGNPLDYFFLDEYYNRQYERDEQFGTVFGIFSILAIFVACLGLFGLASFMTIQRTKEIGIRKVLGSTVPNIVMLLSRGFIQLVLIANLIAWPLSWYLMDNWLHSFPYRIDISFWLFIFSGVIVVLIAFLSVSIQTFRAAVLNPADTLKYE